MAPVVPDDRQEVVCRGFKLCAIFNSVIMRNAETGEVVWEDSSWPDEADAAERIANIPARILACKEVSREVNFSTADAIDKLRLEQTVFLGPHKLEEWIFPFGFVMPQSTNSWQSSVEAAADMLDPAQISGLIVVETCFYNDKEDGGKELIHRSRMRVNYVQ